MELEDDGIPRLFKIIGINDIDCFKGVQLDRELSDDELMIGTIRVPVQGWRLARELTVAVSVTRGPCMQYAHGDIRSL